MWRMYMSGHFLLTGYLMWTVICLHRFYLQLSAIERENIAQLDKKLIFN